MAKRLTLIHIATIIILGFIIYANSLNGKFVWDDYGLIKDNAYIKHWSNLPKVITEDLGAGAGTRSNFYRPLQTILYMAGYSLWGLNVQGYHLISILLHVSAAIAVYFFIGNLFYNPALSFLASLLFVTHPINTEAVSYISGLSDPLALLFMLLCLIFYIKSLSPKSALYILAPLSFAMGLFSKEIVAVIPVLILFYHYVFSKELKGKKIIPFFAILAAYILLRLTVLNPFTKLPAFSGGLLQRVLGFFAAITEYLRLLLLPFGLRVDYGDKIFNPGDPRVIIGVLASFLLLGLLFSKKRNNPLAAFSIGWFFITLLPASNIYPISHFFMMEHWLYIPSLGFFLIVSSAISYPWRNIAVRSFLKYFAVTLIICYSYLTIKQNVYWKEPVTLYERALKYAPESWRFYNELGIEYYHTGRFDEAVAVYNKALEINPDLPGIYNNLAIAYAKMGRDKEALLMYNNAK